MTLHKQPVRDVHKVMKWENNPEVTVEMEGVVLDMLILFLGDQREFSSPLFELVLNWSHSCQKPFYGAEIFHRMLVRRRYNHVYWISLKVTHTLLGFYTDNKAAAPAPKS